MTEPNQQAEALLTEHFRYTPLSLIDEIINAVNTIIYRAIEAIENGLFSIPPTTLGFGQHSSSPSSSRAGRLTIPDADGDGNVGFTEAKDEIEEGAHRLETLLEATVDKTFDKFEIYTLRNILTVPDELAPWMRLGHYENLPLPLPPSAPTPESILTLRRTLRSTHALNRALRTTRAQNANTLSSLTSLLITPQSDSPSHSPHPSLSFLNSSPSASAATSHALPTTRAQFATSNLPALRALLASLRPQLDGLRAAGRGRDEGERLALAPEKEKETETEKENRREERRAYLEGRVRRLVGANAAGEGGSEGGKGRGREVDDILGLERVVRGLGGGGGGGDGGGGEGGGGDEKMEEEG